MPGCNSETLGRFCEGLSSNIVVKYFIFPIITPHGRITAREYLDRFGNQVHPMIQTMRFSKTIVPTFTGLELFSHGLNSMKVNSNIFPGKHNHQILTSLSHSGQFW
jgi:hypothetical protein